MTYLHVDDCFPTHPKVIGLSHRAFRLHVTALCHCTQNLTDGLVTKTALAVVGAVAGKGRALTDELEAAGVWRKVPDGWVIHDYLDWNPSREDVEKRKKAARANANKRWTGDANSNANGIAAGTANGNAKPNALLSSPLEAKASSSAFALSVVADRQEEDAHASGEEALIRVCGTANAVKIRRAIAARKPSYETIARALDAARNPCDSPVAVALAIIAPSKEERTA